VGGEKQDALALLAGARKVLEAVIDDQRLDIVWVKLAEAREVRKHPSKILKRPEQHAPPPPLAPLRKRQAKVEDPDPAQPRPQPVTRSRERSARASDKPRGQPAQKSQDAGHRPILDSML